MEYCYEFVGGRLHGQRMQRNQVEEIATGHSRDWSPERAQGGLVPRVELDNQPTVNGYVGPMWDGLRYKVNGRMKSEWSLTEEEKAGTEPTAILRYETQEVYNMLSR